jgi:hypothetical protein
MDVVEELPFLFEVKLSQCTDGVGHLPKKIVAMLNRSLFVVKFLVMGLE